MGHHGLTLALIVLLGAALRFVALGAIPPGLYHDEAYNGLDALRVLSGARPIFFEANNGREPLFIYLVAGSVALLGPTPIAIRVVSAIVGTLTVLAAYGMAAEWFHRRVGLLTAAVTTISVWPINLSRVGFRAVTMPLLVALVLWGLGRARRTRRLRPMFVSGVLYGLLFYSYLAARITPVALLAGGIYLLATRRWPWTGRQTIVFVVTAFLVALPLLGYMAFHADLVLVRSYQVSIFNPAINGGDLLGTLVRHAGRTLLAFTTRGDFIPRHNVPLRPVFDPLMAVAFLAGLLFALRRFGESPCGLALIWVAVMLLPTVLAEDAPHFLRGVGVLPVLFVVPAVGLDAGWRWLSERIATPTASAVLVLLFATSLGWTVRDYFVRHGHSDAAYYQFETGAVELAAEANRFLGTGWDGSGIAARQGPPIPGRHVYIADRLWEGWAAIGYLVPRSAAVTVFQSAMTPPARRATDVLIFLWPFEAELSYLHLLPRDSLISVREGAWEQGDLEPEPRLLYAVFRATVGATGPGNADARFLAEGEPGTGPQIALTGYELSRRDDQHLLVRLFWQALAGVSRDYTVFVHVVGPEGLIAQDDAQPTRGYYPTSHWRPGDRVVDEHLIELPRDVSQGEARIVVGLYWLETLTRLAVVDQNGQPVADSVTLAWGE